MLKTARSYEEACRTFRWRIPERYNLAFDICDRQTMAGADGYRTALIIEAEDGTVERYTFHMLRLLSNRLANVLVAKGVQAGDRVAVSFGPSVEAAITVLAIAKMGAVAVPIPLSLGRDPVAWRLKDSGAVAAVVDGQVLHRVLAARRQAPFLDTILSLDKVEKGALEFWMSLEQASDSFTPLVTRADDPVFAFYPADGRGEPMAALHAHRSLPGNLPAVEFALDFFARFGDILWAAGEWMSFEGLLWSLLPAWHHGIPAMGFKGKADPERALAMMAAHGTRVATLSVPGLAALADAAAHGRRPIQRALAAFGQMDHALAERVAAIFGVAPNDLWGNRETGGVAANNRQIMEARAGSPGRAVPGVTVEAVDESGRIMRAGETGMLAVAPGAPGACLQYLGEIPPGRLKLPSGWLVSGELGSRDLDGYLWPAPKAAEAGTVSIGAQAVDLDMVQTVLARHPAVRAAGVAMMGNELKAFIVPQSGGDHHLAHEIQDFVADQLGAAEVPRRVEFVSDLPTDGDGKVNRAELLTRPAKLGAPLPDERW